MVKQVDTYSEFEEITGSDKPTFIMFSSTFAKFEK